MELPSFKTILLVLLIAVLVVGCIHLFCTSVNNARESQYWEAMAKDYAKKCDAYNVYYHKNERLLDELSMNYDLYQNDFNVLMTSEFGNDYMDAKKTVDSLCYQKVLDE
jgi:hypothetical protein